MKQLFRITFFGKDGTIYSKVENSMYYENYETLLGEWNTPFEDENRNQSPAYGFVESLAQSEYCPFEFLEGEEIIKVKIEKLDDNDGWIEINLPYWRWESEGDSFERLGLAEPGTLIDIGDGKEDIYLIGHINPLRGTCDCCFEFGNETIVKRYKIIWKEDKKKIED